MEHEKLKNRTREKPPKEHDRKPYLKPQLIEYGQIEKLTESGGTKRNDGGPHTRG